MTPAPILPPDETAALWAARLRSGGLAPGQRAELAAWLRADPAHAACFAAYCDDSADYDAALLVLKSEGLAVEAEPAETAAPRRRLAPWAALALAGASLLAVLLWPARGREFHTAPGRPDTLVLDDGTRIELNANTVGQVRYDRASRAVVLQSGEALFSVAKDPARPFTVQTVNGLVRVTGTVFNVRAQESAGEEVTVLEGRVEVSSPAASRQPVVLHAGDQARLYGATPEARRLSAAEQERVTAWRHGLVIFDDEPLRSALERVASFHGTTIEVSSQLDGLTLGGRYDLGNLDAFLDGLAQVHPLRVLRGDQGRVRIVPR